MLVVLDVNNWVEKRCMKIEPTLPNILYHQCSPKVVSSNNKYGKLFAVNKKVTTR